MPKGYRSDGTPNGKGYPHGGNGKTADEWRKMQGAYVEARLEGKNPRESREIAGYSADNTHLETAGSVVDQKINAALDKAGITDEWIAEEYKSGIELSKRDGSKDINLNAHAQYLRQLSYLRRHGREKPAPAVAVQINNNAAPGPGVDASRLRELISLFEEAVADIKSGGIHAERSGPPDTTAHPGMAEIDGGEKAAGDRGQP